MRTFGERLRVAIEQHQEMTITEFANRTGFSVANVSHFLSGQRKPGLDSLATMIEALPGTNLHWLITGVPK